MMSQIFVINLTPSPANVFEMPNFIQNMKVEIKLSIQKCCKDGSTTHIKCIKLCIFPDLININWHIIK